MAKTHNSLLLTRYSFRLLAAFNCIKNSKGNKPYLNNLLKNIIPSKNGFRNANIFYIDSVPCIAKDLNAQPIFRWKSNLLK